jgi:hypothetical protein
MDNKKKKSVLDQKSKKKLKEISDKLARLYKREDKVFERLQKESGGENE